MKKDLHQDVALGVIKPVPINTPVEWCSRMVVVPKHDGSPRRTVDFSALNKASRRQTHHTRSPFALASQVPRNMKKSVLDVWNAYHSVPVREEDQHKLTFITQWGRYRYKKAPQGYLASGDGYTHRDSLIAQSQNIKNKVIIVADSLLWDQDIDKNVHSVCKMITTYGRSGLVFNSEKFQFAQDTVKFAGFEVTNNGIKPAREYLRSIEELPAPTCISDVRSFFGMINQISYAFSMSEVMSPFRHLLKPGCPFIWNHDLQMAFDHAKKVIVEVVTEGVTHFEIGRKTCLMFDLSKKGIGFLLLQKWCTCSLIHPRCCVDGWKLTLAGGRFTTAAESRYSPIEGECLAVGDSLQKAKPFVIGFPDLLVATDHKPLLGLFKKQFSEIKNPRLLSLVEKTLWFRFDIIHVQGRINCGPDYMSRSGKMQKDLQTDDRYEHTDPQIASVTSYIGNEDGIEDQDIDVSIAMMVVGALQNDDNLKVITLDAVRDATRRDDRLNKLKNILLEPANAEILLPHDLADYNRYRDRLSVLDGCLLYGNRLVIPTELQYEVFEPSSLCSSRDGRNAIKSQTISVLAWPVQRPGKAEGEV